MINVYPMVNTIRLSFQNQDSTAYDPTDCREGEPCWGIFENYRYALTDEIDIVPILGFYKELGLNGAFIGVWLFYSGFGMLYAIYLMRNFLGGTTPVMTYQISNMVTSLGAGWHLLTDAAFLSLLLPLIIFISLQRFFVRGMLADAVKG